jgi:3-hydroxyisobutyrate dehydrogenase
LVALPVLGSRPQAEAGQLIALAGGSDAAVARLRPLWQPFIAGFHHVGSVAQAMAYKLAVNALFAVQVAALGEVVALLQRTGVDAPQVAALFGNLPQLSPAAKGALALLANRQFAPMFPIDLVHKDLRYAQASAQSLGLDVATIAAVAERYAAAQAVGLGNEHIVAIAKLSEG